MSDERPGDPQMNAAALYREDIFTDQRVGTVRRLTPVTAEGADDPARPTIFIGQEPSARGEDVLLTAVFVEPLLDLGDPFRQFLQRRVGTFVVGQVVLGAGDGFVRLEQHFRFARRAC